MANSDNHEELRTFGEWAAEGKRPPTGTKLICSNPDCRSIYEMPPLPVKKYCSPACKRKAENARKRTSSPVTSNARPTWTTEELLEELSRRGYYVEVNEAKEDRKFKLDTGRFKGDYFEIGVISCTHLCSRYQQLTALREFYKVCADREIDKVFHAGDLCDGDGTIYKGHAFEMFCLGYEAQKNYILENYPREEGITTYVINGNHDYSYVKSIGANILESIAKEREDIKYLGSFGAYIKIENIDFYLMHGDGGVAYARSYKPQKIIEGFSPEAKPHILLAGHWHVSCHLPAYRNVEGFMLPAFQAQTPYLKRKGINPVVAGLILRVYPDDKGLAKITTEWLHWYIMRERDY